MRRLFDGKRLSFVNWCVLLAVLVVLGAIIYRAVFADWQAHGIPRWYLVYLAWQRRMGIPKWFPL